MTSEPNLQADSTPDHPIQNQSISDTQALPADDAKAVSHGFKFWMIFAALSVTGLLAAVEATVTSTALPTISHDLNLGSSYAWVVNVYFLTSMIFQPLYGQLADVFGRRWLMISSVLLLIFGSGISGGASGSSMLIGGRTVQGIGGGGINMLIELIICDLVPLRERSKYLGIVLSTFFVGTSLGPFIGGIIVQNTTWRWVFYLNLPIGGAALVLLFLFLQVEYTKDSTLMEKFRRIDIIGNVVLVPSLIAILIALTDAGTIAPWSSYKILLPLILGLIGLISYWIYEISPYCAHPTIPRILFSNRTTLTAFGLTFLHVIVSIWAIYFLPVYFQSVLISDPARSGVQVLPMFMFIVPFAMISGVVISKTGRYRPLHHIGFAIIIIGFGIASTMNTSTTTAEWVIYQAILAAGLGLVTSALLPAIQAELSEELTASSTATFAFIRSFGAVWGLTIPAAVFNNAFNHLAPSHISDPAVRQLFSGGQAYARATRAYILSIGDETTMNQIRDTYSASLQRVWFVGVGIAGVGFLLVFALKEVTLRTELKSEYGIKAKREVTDEDSVEKGKV